MSPDERRFAILSLLGEKGRLPVGDLAGRFATSEDSIRRDLRHLAAEGLIRRVHGAVLPAGSTAVFAARPATPEKSAVAARAAALIGPARTILVDGGTTTLAAIDAFHPPHPVTVVTTSLPVALALADRDGVSVVLVGGSVDRDSRTVVGGAAVEAVRAVRADLCLLGLCSLDPDAGITAAGYEEACVKRAMIEQSGSVLALATADKLGTVSPHLVAGADRIDRLVTDAAAAPDLLDRFRALGVEVVIASSGP